MGITMILETHSPHGSSASGRDLRPFGSSVWLRWPEFGIGLRPVDPSNSSAGVDVEHWRGPRDVRPWPNRLMRGKRWPWTPDQMPTGTFARHNRSAS
jgi:replicative DNA helicase